MKSFKPGTRSRRHKGYRGGPPPPGQFTEPAAGIGPDGNIHIIQASKTHPRPKGGAGEHFPPWVNASQAHNFLSFNDLLHSLPDVVKLIGEDPQYTPHRAAFQKVRSRGSPYWGKVNREAFAQ